MTKAELDQQVQALLARPGIAATAYFVLNARGNLVVKRADLDEALQLELRNTFVTSVRRDILDATQLVLVDLSTADDRANALYRYDLDETPAGLRAFDLVLANDDLPDFSFTYDDFGDITAIVVVIGDHAQQIVLYKKHYPVSLLKRDSVLKIIRADTRFTKLDKDVLKINDTFDFMKCGDELYIMNLTTLERFFGFHEVIVRRAQEGLTVLQQAQLVDNPEKLEELLVHPASARKLIKVSANSPVLRAGVPKADIIAFTRSYPLLTNRFEYSDDGTKIHLHSKASINLFLKLLNDDYLRSELTKKLYDSSAKDAVDAGALAIGTSTAPERVHAEA